jgi:choline dehydrogenase-like flavoprotein
VTGNSLFTATASNEIILSAGAVGTPTILMHSGIGDRKILDPLGISTVLHLPSVGQNTSDHPIVSVGWSVNFNQTLESIVQNTTRFNEVYAQWNESHTGPFAMSATTNVAWLRLDTSIFGSHTDPSAGPDTPHIEILFTVCAR